MICTDVTESQTVGPSSPGRQPDMEYVARLADGLAHDFNNLLTIIMANLAFVAETPEIPTDCRKAAQAATSAAQRGALLTERLRAFSRGQDLRSAVVDVAELLADVEVDRAREFGPVLEIETSSDGDGSQLLADPDELRKALHRLLTNARDAVPETGGKVSVRAATAEAEQSDPTAHGPPARREYVVLTVADNGRGMTEATVERAFEPFFSTKDPMTGRGLGLSIVDCFAKQSGGDLEIVSTVGEGTTVKMYLPRANPRKLESGVR